MSSSNDAAKVTKELEMRNAEVLDAQAMAARLPMVKADLEKLACGGLTVEIVGGSYYAWGSELQCLRIERAYPRNEKYGAKYSVNMNCWYFRLSVY